MYSENYENYENCVINDIQYIIFSGKNGDEIVQTI
jgi:hypothetical protein